MTRKVQLFCLFATLCSGVAIAATPVAYVYVQQPVSGDIYSAPIFVYAAASGVSFRPQIPPDLISQILQTLHLDTQLPGQPFDQGLAGWRLAVALFAAARLASGQPDPSFNLSTGS
jgi:hypothetical protein